MVISMTDDNSTANYSITNTTRTALDGFFDPAWHLALSVEFYFRYAVLAIGIFGTAANGLVLYALCANIVQDVKKRVINLLIINQNLLDLSCCILLVITVCIQLSNISLIGTAGYFLCALFISDTTTYCVLYGSTIDLVAVTGERYLKVVHPFWSKKHLKRWMVYAAMVFAWIGGIVYSAIPIFAGARVENGLCLVMIGSYQSQYIYGSFNLVLFFFLPLILFIYCYGRIVFVMRRQMRVMAGHTGEGSSQMSASQAQSKRVKWNIIKTMIIVSVSFAICWCPHSILFLVMTNSIQVSALVVGYYPTVFLVYLNICMNPFIYAMKHDGVKKQLARVIRCHKPSDAGDESGTSSRTRAGGTQQMRTVK